jgi:hypothetical protein
MQREQARGVGAEAEERRVAERWDSGVAEQEIQREREQPADENLAAEQEMIRKQEVARGRADPEQDFVPAPAAARGEQGDGGVRSDRAHRHRRPIRPCGRISKTTTVTA